ncbi:MAG: RNA polymerase sigma factor [Ruminococcus sp.]|nr:RNA polymerase sigma factor [Ruminococcus sp.]
MNDNEILELFSISPKKAYGQIIEQYGNLVYAIVANKLNLCAVAEDVEDCTSDIFVEVFRNMNNFSLTKGTLKNFISAIAKRSAIDAYRRLSYRQRVTDETDISETDFTDTSEDVEETVMNNISRQNVRNAVMSLKEPERSIIIHQYYYNHTIREIAGILSMTVGAVQQRSLRARKRIEKMLEKG